MTQSALRVVYRPTETDLADQSMRIGDPEHVDLVEFEEVPASDASGRQITGTATDGRDVVVWVASGTVRARDGGDGTYNQYLGTLEEFKGVTVSA